MKITWWGHATCVIESGDEGLITDPLLRGQVWFLRRVSPLPDGAFFEKKLTVLLSHLHGDHYDLKSLRRLKNVQDMIVPTGGKKQLENDGFRNIRELGVNGAFEIGTFAIKSLNAEHVSKAPFGSGTASLSYVIEAEGKRVFFAGDTTFNVGMRKLGQIDVALLPVWGWGPLLGPGHMNPRTAAVACQAMRPDLAIPIHWGTYGPWGLEKFMQAAKTKPPLLFERYASMLAKETSVRILQVGERIEV